LISLELLTDPIRVRFSVAPFHVGDDALKRAGNLVNAAALIITEANFLFAGTIKEDLIYMGGKVSPLRRFIEFVLVCVLFACL